MAQRASSSGRTGCARLLRLPADGRAEVSIGRLDTDSFFVRLRRSYEHAPQDAQFEPVAGGIRLRRSHFGRSVDEPATSAAILRAALSPTRRFARLVAVRTPPKLTTAEAKKLGIKQIVGTYTTIYGGIANRIHNVQLVAHLIDQHFIRPGEEFSFNKTTGVRDASKGFLEAPVIINGELQTGLGGGVCQVSTTVFNAAYEAGLKITSRTNHALYISHYPLGRDATVNYPDTDLRFVNDTDHWLLLRTFVGSSALTVTLYGTSPHRRVESEAAPLTVAGPVPVRTTTDAALLVGRTVVDVAGSPALQTSVERKVFDRNGTLLYDDHWSSHYRGEYRLVRVGSKKPPKKKPPVTRRRLRRRPPRRRRRRPRLRLCLSYRVDDPPRQTRRPQRVRVNACVGRPPLGDARAVALPRQHVVVAEARSTDVDATSPDPDHVVEHRRRQVTNVSLDDRRLEARVLERTVSRCVLIEVCDPRDLEPDEVRRVVRDPLCVGLREADAHVRREAEALHMRTLRCTNDGVVTVASTVVFLAGCKRCACGRPQSPR